jgi:anti-sigma factor RsiW
MNNMEELLWNYIDGNCTPDEQVAINELIAQDEAWRLRYQELLKLNIEFSAIELDEPPMAFTYNVMEAVRAGHAQQPLKAAVNKRIILGITIFFVVTIAILLVYTLANINWSASSGITVTAPSEFKVPDMSSYITKPVIQGFLFFDVVLSLFLFDKWLRNRKPAKQA